MRRVVLLSSACVVGPSALGAQVHGVETEAIGAARSAVQSFMETHTVPGISVAVAIDTHIVWSQGFGYADLRDSTPVSAETQFRVGSISMALTAAGVGLLLERQQLSLSTPIRRYVPAFPHKRHDIAVGQVAGHMGGIRHYRGEEFYSTRHYNSIAEGLEIFARDSLEYEPGTRFSFSSYGWNLLSAAIESVAKQDFLVFMQREVFDALGLRGTQADHVDVDFPNRTRFYQLNDAQVIEEAPFVDNSYKWASGGFLSTPNDLVRFGLAHLGSDFLSPKTVKRLWTSQRTNDGVETGYGIGWWVGRDADGRRVVSHTGSSVGGRAILLIYPDDRVVVAVLANRSGVRFRGLPQEIAEAFIQ
ncbi:MAG: beta-lactamase family protein [Gemmatimonadota bacterium]|nr:beta-lactamase family protein [Gemmatimonadota bacterium]